MSRRIVLRSLYAEQDDGMDAWCSEPPTPADIAAWLHAHPAEAVEIVRGLKVAGPWEYNRTAQQDDEFYQRRDDRRTLRAQADRDGDWVVWSDRDAFRPMAEGTTDSWDEAKATADAALRAAGWSLA